VILVPGKTQDELIGVNAQLEELPETLCDVHVCVRACGVLDGQCIATHVYGARHTSSARG
jgi:hypothetical protein